MAALESFCKAMIAKDRAALEKLLTGGLIYVHSASQVGNQGSLHPVDRLGQLGRACRE